MEESRPARSSVVTYALALAFVALVPRLFVAIAWSREPVWDGHYYHFGAERLAQGLGYSEDAWDHGRLIWKPWVHYPVGYSALLSIFYVVFGSGLLVAPLVNALIGTLLCVLTYLFALHCLSPNRAMIAGGLVALHPGLIAYSALVMTEPLAGLCLIAAGLAALTLHGTTRASVWSGVALGFGSLVRPTSLLVGPLIAAIRPASGFRGLWPGVVATLLALAVVAPWTIRNCRTLDGCALVSTNGGWNLAIGAISETGRFQTLRASDGCAVVTGQVQQDRCWAEVGWNKITDAPGAWLAMVPKKLGETMNHESFAVEYLHEADPSAWPDGRREAGRWLFTTFHRALLLLAALGLVAVPRRGATFLTSSLAQGGVGALALLLGVVGFLSDAHPFQWLAIFVALVGWLPLPGRPHLPPGGRYVLGLLALTLATHAVFFGEDRYHIVVSPLLCILAAAALRRSSEPEPRPEPEPAPEPEAGAATQP